MAAGVDGAEAEALEVFVAEMLGGGREGLLVGVLEDEFGEGGGRMRRGKCFEGGFLIDAFIIIFLLRERTAQKKSIFIS